MSTTASIVWLRLDLRLADQPALEAAMRRGGPVLPVFLWAPEEEAPWVPGAASQWWLDRSLRALSADLQRIGSRLVVRCGPTLEVLQGLVRETGAGAVFWNRRYEPAVIARDSRIKEALRGTGIQAESFNGALLHEPWTIQNQQGRPFQVFTPFWRHCLAKTNPTAPLPSPTSLVAPGRWPKSESIDALGLRPRIPWDAGLQSEWVPGEAGAEALLDRFCGSAFERYGTERDRPDRAGTSRLSPHLHFGEITPRQIWHGLRARFETARLPGWKTSQYVTEVGWREFSHHLLYHFPDTPTAPLRPQWARFPWRTDEAQLRAWQRGRTGYPIVDAGLRELWATGWMHNRVRMIVASFLVKDLMISWQEGARWFWDTLVDADLAQNTLGWQWSAGCGADAAPYFRVFNPVSQGTKFDPDGTYVRKWVPELARLSAGEIHAPWLLSAGRLAQAGVRLGQNYPLPIVDHAVARNAALAAYAGLREEPAEA